MSVLIGNVVKVMATFKDDNNVKQDPSVVAVKVKKPDASITTYTYSVNPELVRQSQGVYYILIDTTAQLGTFQFVWNSSGSYKAAGQTQFTVENTYFT